MRRAETDAGGLVRVTRYAQLDDEFYLEIDAVEGPTQMVVVPGETLEPEADTTLVCAALDRLGISLPAASVPPLKDQAARCRRTTSGTWESFP